MDNLLIDVQNIDFDAQGFCEFLTQATCANLLVRISEPQPTFQKSLNIFENFLNDPNNLYVSKNSYGVKNLNIRQILKQGAYNLECKNYGRIFQIDINKNAIVPGTFLKIKNICSLVDAGNFNIKGTRLFSDCFKDMENNYGKYIDEFLLGVNYVNRFI